MTDPGRRFTTQDQEAETLCRGCGYNTTDEERKFYGQYTYELCSTPRHRKIVKQYHFCTFCVEDSYYKRELYFLPKKWQPIDYQIHEVKVKLRDKSLKSSGYLYLKVLCQEHENQNYAEIHNASYKTDDSGNRIYNEHEAKFQELKTEIGLLRNYPRHLYLEALEEFGGVSDEPPCTRNLTTKQKKKLLKKLKDAIRAS